MSVADLLHELTDAGVALSIAPDDPTCLDVDGPANALTPNRLDRLRRHKLDLLAILRPRRPGTPAQATTIALNQPPPAPATTCTEVERLALSQAPAATRATVDAIKQAFASTGGATVLSVESKPTPRGYVACNPDRQRIIDLLLPIFRADPDRGTALRDQWAERLAIVEGDADCAHLAEKIATDEILLYF